MLYSISSAVCKSQAGNDFWSGALGGSGKCLVADSLSRFSESKIVARPSCAQELFTVAF